MIAVAPPDKIHLNHYTTWLEELKLPYCVLNTGDNINHQKISMLMLCGGPDVGQKGEELRESNDINWFKQSYGKIPVLGICRGLQLTNIVLGGTLHEDLPEIPVKHTPVIKSVLNETGVVKESSFHDVIYNHRKIRVNSRHHQGIKILAEGLKPLAICAEDSLIEMMKGINSLFVQWHPEREELRGTEAEKLVSNWIKERVIQKF